MKKKTKKLKEKGKKAKCCKNLKTKNKKQEA